MGLAFYKRYPRDFIAGTVGMDLETKGGYSILLDLIYAHDGALVDDPRFVAGVLGCSVRKWNAIKNTLVNLQKISCEDGFISNFRASFELINARKIIDKNAENRTGLNKNSDLKSRSRAPADLTEPETDTDSKRDTYVSPKNPTKKSKAIGSRLPDDWIIPGEWITWAASNGINEEQANAESEKFKDYWISQAGPRASKTNWQAIWRNWVRKYVEDSPGGGTSARSRTGFAGSKAINSDANTERRRNAMRSAIETAGRSGHGGAC